MASIPNINIANPIRISPTSFLRSLLLLIIKIIPITARIGEKDVGFSILIKKLLLSIPVRLNNHEVAVVPILAPIIIPIACDSFIIPEFTNPTSITVVADDDCMTAVTPAPNNTAFSGFEVSFSRIRSSFPPETFSNPPPITFIPYKNKANPPSNDRNPKIFIFHPPK